MFRSELGSKIFKIKYGHAGSWSDLIDTVVGEVTTGYLTIEETTKLKQFMKDFKFVVAGRYLYYAGRKRNFYNNCVLQRAEDTREGWSKLFYETSSALMCGAGVGVDYSDIRASGLTLSNTGGTASGPISLMRAIDAIAEQVRQGGSRRSACFASLSASHPDIDDFIKLKQTDGEIPFTNISVNFNTLAEVRSQVFKDVVRSACKYGSPGLSFNIKNPRESLRNACCEITSEDNNDICNLGSINLANIKNIAELEEVVYLAQLFLLCGSQKAEVPHIGNELVRRKNNRIGLGIMGLHEWLLQRGYKYEANEELTRWLSSYKLMSQHQLIEEFCYNHDIPVPVKFRAIAPTGTISILAGTTSGIEPIFCPSYLRGYHHADGVYKHEYAIDPTARYLYEKFNVEPDDMESAYNIEPKRRIEFQAYIQRFVDQAISSTVNLSRPLTDAEADEIAEELKKHADVLRGITFYPDGAKGNQPFQPVSFIEALEHEGEDRQVSVCELNGGGICGE